MRCSNDHSVYTDKDRLDFDKEDFTIYNLRRDLRCGKCGMLHIDAYPILKPSFNLNGRFELKDIEVRCPLCITDKIDEARKKEFIKRRRKLIKPNRMKNAFRGLSVSEKVLIRLKRPHILNLIKGNASSTFIIR